MTGFYMKRNTGLKWVNFMANHAERFFVKDQTNPCSDQR